MARTSPACLQLSITVAHAPYTFDLSLEMFGKSYVIAEVALYPRLCLLQIYTSKHSLGIY